MAQHRVELVQALGLPLQALERTPDLLRKSVKLVIRVRNELVKRRIEQADRDRQALHLAEEAFEVALLHRQDLGQSAFAAVLRVGEDHLANRVDAIGLEEHVLGTAKPDALGAELRETLASCGVSAFARTPICLTGRPRP